MVVTCAFPEGRVSGDEKELEVRAKGSSDGVSTFIAVLARGVVRK